MKTYKPVYAEEIEVINGDSKNYPENSELEVSFDAHNFERIGQFENGTAVARVGGKKIKAINIKVTGVQTGWVIIREIIIR